MVLENVLVQNVLTRLYPKKQLCYDIQFFEKNIHNSRSVGCRFCIIGILDDAKV